MMPDALYDRLNALRDEYRNGMNVAAENAQRFAQTEEMDRVSEWSTQSGRYREAFHALNRAITLVENSFTAGEGGEK